MLTPRIKSILLVDDNPADNLFHQLLIDEMKVTETLIAVEDGEEAIDYLRTHLDNLPSLIFLDINMPRMNGWEFLDEYDSFPSSVKSKIIIIMLSTSANPKDISRSQEYLTVSNFETKPLTKESLENILDHYF